jgi:hypothetical protein
MLKPPRNVGAVQNAGLHDVAAIAVDQVFAGRLVPTLGKVAAFWLDLFWVWSWGKLSLFVLH